MIKCVSPTVPEGPPLNITIETYLSPPGEKLNISWLPPETPNGKIVYYQLNVTDTESDVPLVYSTNQTSLETDVLEYYRRYSVSVLAATIAGSGPASEPKVHQTQEGSKSP